MNPSLVIEVLSESPVGYDRGEKFTAYRTIESLQEYVIVSQTEPAIETFNRQPDGSWRLDAYRGIDARVTLRSLKIEISMKEIFAGVTFRDRRPNEDATSA